MLTEICQYLRNWFNRKPDGSDYPKYDGEFTISDGELDISDFDDGDLVTGQYYRIMGSLFNDGVHVYGDETDTLTDEDFEGSIWTMGVPPAVISLADEIETWQSTYGGADSSAMSPFQSESFGGYSYTKASGSSSTGGTTSGATWESVYAKRLSPWRKI